MSLFLLHKWMIEPRTIFLIYLEAQKLWINKERFLDFITSNTKPFPNQNRLHFPLEKYFFNFTSSCLLWPWQKENYWYSSTLPPVFPISPSQLWTELITSLCQQFYRYKPPVHGRIFRKLCVRFIFYSCTWGMERSWVSSYRMTKIGASHILTKCYSRHTRFSSKQIILLSSSRSKRWFLAWKLNVYLTINSTISSISNKTVSCGPITSFFVKMEAFDIGEFMPMTFLP